MSAMAINLAEKKIQRHIMFGGSPMDAVGQELIAKFAYTALKDANIAQTASKYNISMNDICILYAAMIDHLMPNPCIVSGGNLLVPTLYFMEPYRFEGLCSDISVELKLGSEDEKKQRIVFSANAAAEQTWNAHTHARGEAPFKIIDAGGLRASSGCIFIILSTVVSVMAIAIVIFIVF